MGEVTQILDAFDPGDDRSAARLLEAVYAELRSLARHRLAQEQPGQTLQPTALVHEAWLRLQGSSAGSFQSRAHFFAAAAEAMRRILIDAARRKARLKRGGDRKREPLDPDAAVVLPVSIDVLALDEALTRLEREDERKARLVELRFFAGLHLAEIAEVLGVSLATAERDWAYARAWLFDALGGEKSESP